MSFIIRTFKPKDYEVIRDIGNRLGWNLGKYEHLAYSLLNKNTHLIGELDGKPIASIMFSQYNENFAFGGLYLCDPKYQGKGYGQKVFNEAMRRINAKTFGGDSAEELENKYFKQGLKTYHKTISYIINGTGVPYKA